MDALKRQAAWLVYESLKAEKMRADSLTGETFLANLFLKIDQSLVLSMTIPEWLALVADQVEIVEIEADLAKTLTLG